MKRILYLLPLFFLLGADGTQLPENVNFGSSSSRTSITNGNVNFGLNTTFINSVRLRTDSAGTDLATATQIVARIIEDQAGDGTKGVKLPATPNVGDFYIIYQTSGAITKVYPGEAGDQIRNTAGAGLPVSLAANGAMICYAVSTSVWQCMEALAP